MNKTILIIDDEASLLEAYDDRLTKDGFRVITATNGELGLAAAEAEKPDLILLDLYMPVMDGRTMLEKLRAQEWGKAIPVIVATNSGDANDILATLQGNAQAYFIKADTNLDTLVASIRDILPSSN